MSAIHYKSINGILYAYDVQSFRDKESKKVKKKTTYLGRVVDKAKGIYEKYSPQNTTRENLILNFGNTYTFVESFKQSPYYSLFTEVFKDSFDTLMSLILYKIFEGDAMQYAATWAEGNYVSILFKNAKLSSQRISEFLEKLGDEKINRTFFEKYLKILSKGNKISTLVDSTGLPNHIDFELSEWSNHGGSLQEETRLLFVIDRNSKMPTYFRYMAGNIVDVSTVTNTVEELREFGVELDFSILDAGYFSEENIIEFYDKGIPFLTRLPSNRKIYQYLIQKHGKNIESEGDIVVYGDRTLIVKRVEIELYKHNGYAYIIYDLKRYADEANKYIIHAKDDKLTDDEIREELIQKGKLIFISSEKIETTDIIPLYYTRQLVENTFGICKSKLNLLPLRVHSIDSFRGYIMLSFLALIVELTVQNQLNQKFTVEDVAYTTKNLMCKVYDKTVLVCETNKKTKEIFSLLNISVIKKFPLS